VPCRCAYMPPESLVIQAICSKALCYSAHCMELHPMSVSCTHMMGSTLSLATASGRVVIVIT
jgi:hypothetical protein